MEFDIEKLKEKAEEDYEKAWRDSESLVEKEGKYFSLQDEGEPHPLFDLVQEFRQILLDSGFREIVVPALIEEEEIHMQYGPQAPIILDRIFFLAGLDRSDLGISRGDLEQIREKIPGFDEPEKLESIFRRYKQGEISADDLTEVLVEELGIEDDQASYILSLFEDFKKLEPVPSKMTLRSHTTAGWFPVLREMQYREPYPIQLFTVDSKYRREQKLDETHLYRSWTASIVILAEEISLEDGKEVTTKILNELGFNEVEFKKKSATSKYYAPNSEFEIFVSHPETGEMIEIGNAGLYNPVSLANYDISHPVFNLGIGLERILMIRTGEEDMRSLIYPHKYEQLDLSDEEISRMIELKKKPSTEQGREISKRIEKVARDRKDEPSPCEFEVFEGEVSGKNISVKLIEPEENTQLIGPAGFNEIYVKDGNIIGVPPEGWEGDEFLRDVRESGIDTGITYMESFANRAAREIELAVEEGKDSIKIQVPISENLSDINLKLEKPARRFITDNNKKIDVRGPIFTTISAEVSNSS